MPDVILDPFHRTLKVLIDDALDDAIEGLAAGSAKLVPEDASSVAEKYAAQVSRIQTFRVVLEMCKAVEAGQHELNPRPAKVNVQER